MQDNELLQAISDMMDKKLNAESQTIKSEIIESERRTQAHIDDRITESENLVLKYIDDIQAVIIKDIEQVEKNLAEINQYYRIRKLEDENTAYLLKLIRELSERVEALEKKTA